MDTTVLTRHYADTRLSAVTNDVRVFQEACHKTSSTIRSWLEDLGLGGNGHIFLGSSGLTAGASNHTFLEVQYSSNAQIQHPSRRDIDVLTRCLSQNTLLVKKN